MAIMNYERNQGNSCIYSCIKNKIFRNKFNEGGERHNTENCKTVMKEIEGKLMERYSMLLDWKN